MSLLKSSKIITVQQARSYCSQLSKEWQNAKPFEKIPGPKGFWDVLKLMSLPKSPYYNKPMNEILKLFRKDYGDLVLFPNFLGSKPIVMTYRPEDFEKIFRSEGRYPYRRNLETIAYYRKKMRPELFPSGGGLAVDNGESWYEIRKKVNPIMMQPKNVKMYISGIESVTKDFIIKIRELKGDKMEVPDNFLESLNEWALESIALIALDTRLNLFKGENMESKQLYELVKEFFAFTYEYDVKPSVWRYYKTNGFRKGMEKLDKVTNIIFKHINEALEKYEKNPSSSGNESILEKLLKIDKNIATVMAADMLGAGIDTTSSAAAACLYCLATNPDKQEKLREEIKKILPSKDSKLNEKSLDNVPYMRAVLRESLRIFPIFNGNSRALDQDIVLQGYRIPKGVDFLMVQTGSIDFKDADKFIPERWIRNSSAACPHSEKIHPFCHLPFGFGSRMCVGRRMAEMEIEILIAKLLREFKLEWNGKDFKWNSIVINVPSSPLKFKLIDL